MKKIGLLFLLLCGALLYAREGGRSFYDYWGKPRKIVGLIAARNEEPFIRQCLKCLALYADAIVFLDDASTDATLSIVESLAQECHIEIIIRKDVWFRDETGDKNLLLKAGREIGGTHFIVLDADELITAPCFENNYLRHKILELKPKQRLLLHLFNIWRSPYTYRSDSSPWGGHFGDFIFCDDGTSLYTSDYFLHTTRCPVMVPQSQSEQMLVKINNSDMAILHFQFANWRNLLVKQAWYRCLEHIRLPNKPVEVINELYGHSKNEKTLQLTPIPAQWVAGYDFYDPTIFSKPEVWREKQITGWFKEYGIDYFKELDIWDIDWKLDVL